MLRSGMVKAVARDGRMKCDRVGLDGGIRKVVIETENALEG